MLRRSQCQSGLLHLSDMLAHHPSKVHMGRVQGRCILGQVLSGDSFRTLSFASSLGSLGAVHWLVVLGVRRRMLLVLSHTHTHTRTRVEEKLSAHFRPWWPLVQDMREGLATQLAVPRPWHSRAQALPQPSPHSQALNALPTSARVRRSSWSWRLLDRGHHRHGLFTRLRLQLGLWKCEMQCNV